MATFDGDPYEILRVRSDATTDEIDDAFRRLARTHHPDKCGGDPAATQRFARISAAHDLLADPTKRAAYDAEHGPDSTIPEAADFLVGAAINTATKARAAVGDASFADFASRVGKNLVARAATPEGRAELEQAGSVLEQGFSSLFRP